MIWSQKTYTTLGFPCQSLSPSFGNLLLWILISILYVSPPVYFRLFFFFWFSYKLLLKQEISVFLIRTAQWSLDWFNKPKFHVILHLPNHIRHFGPAILFATEAFESFNAVIHAKSVHSNRQAPSWDIGLAFAQGNRIWHLLSGGYFIPVDFSLPSPTCTIISATTTDMWRTISHGPQQLMAISNTATSYLGLHTTKGSKEKTNGAFGIPDFIPCVSIDPGLIRNMPSRQNTIMALQADDYWAKASKPA